MAHKATIYLDNQLISLDTLIDSAMLNTHDVYFNSKSIRWLVYYCHYQRIYHFSHIGDYIIDNANDLIIPVILHNESGTSVIEIAPEGGFEEYYWHGEHIIEIETSV